MTRAATPVAVALEQAPKRTFACALDWPGWCRSGRTPEAALEALAAYAARFAPVAGRAGTRFPAGAADRLEVVEHLPGSASTEFGVPGCVAEADRRPTSRADAARLARLVEAAWATLDEVVAASPATLRKGPRGGGRDRDAVAHHVAEAEAAYARQMGLRVSAAASDDEGAAGRDHRSLLVEVLARPSDGTPLGGRRWPARYAARRIAWHALDHAWEIEDRREPG